MSSRRSLARCVPPALVIAALAVPHATMGDQSLPAKGRVEVKSYAVPGSSTPRIVVRAVVDLPARKIWQVVSDCAHYKDRLPRVAASELLKQEGNVHTCKVTIAMPFPFANLTGVTEAVNEESEAALVRRWKLVSGDYKVNEGSWEVRPLDKSGAPSLVIYTVRAEPNTPMPEFIREAAQKKLLPEMIERVTAEAGKLP